MYVYHMITLPETNISPENRPKPNRKVRIVFQPSIFRGELLVSGRVHTYKIPLGDINKFLAFAVHAEKFVQHLGA